MLPVASRLFLFRWYCQVPRMFDVRFNESEQLRHAPYDAIAKPGPCVEPASLNAIQQKNSREGPEVPPQSHSVCHTKGMTRSAEERARDLCGDTIDPVYLAR